MVRPQFPFPVPILLSPQRAADMLGIGRTSLLTLLREKKIKAKVFKGRHYFTTVSLLEYLKTLADAA